MEWRRSQGDSKHIYKFYKEGNPLPEWEKVSKPSVLSCVVLLTAAGVFNKVKCIQLKPARIMLNVVTLTTAGMFPKTELRMKHTFSPTFLYWLQPSLHGVTWYQRNF